MAGVSESDGSSRTWLASFASLTAAAAVIGGLLGTTTTLLITLPPSFGTVEVSLDFFFGLVRLFRVLTALGLGGVCALLAGRAPHLVVAVSVGLTALLLLATLVWSLAGGPFVASLSAEQARGEPRLFLYAAVMAYWGRVVLMILLGATLVRVGHRLPALLLFMLGVLEMPSLGPSLVTFPTEWLVLVLGFSPFGPGLVGAVCWTLLGVTLFRSGRELEEDRRQTVLEENCRKARRLYEEALGAGNLSVVDELVAPDFFDHRHQRRGPQGFKRTIEDLRRTFPDLRVSVEEQTAEGNTVTTRNVLSGTDLGGVLWYPPTNRSAAFTVTYTDRFSGGRMVEHQEQADMKGLLEQLGLPETRD